MLEAAEEHFRLTPPQKRQHYIQDSTWQLVEERGEARRNKDYTRVGALKREITRAQGKTKRSI